MISRIKIPPRNLFTMIVTGKHESSADEYIVAHVTENDIAVTRDIQLAARLVEKRITVLNDRGIEYSSGTVADCNQASLLMEDLEAEAFLADKAYDANELLGMLKEADIKTVIPPIKSRKEQRAYNHELYRARHVIENVFRALKRWRGIATR
ncbi:DUF188 domain-containing protein, partial [Treponema endosymbiont of Eucomonympha sp.]|uniref:DUF188 domain-containing protein n=1 Tax=Treponema endosymbiont of Eucomonympha sp. TaxID=1580831 RepID=UPI00164F363C